MKALIVDDSLTVRMDLDEAFRNAGWDTLLCVSAAEARRRVSETQVDAIILDLLLPDGSGIDLLREFRKGTVNARAPIILLLAQAELEADLHGVPWEADAYIGKPYDRSYLVSQAEELARKRECLPAQSATFENLAAAGSLHGKKKILAVDDSPTYLHALASELIQDSFEVVMAHSGAEALQLLASQPADCILLDLMMPDLSGQETCRRIRENPAWRGIPVIMLTGMEDRQTMVESFNAGADDFVPKSTETSVLRARVRAQLRRKRFEDEAKRAIEELHHKEIEIAEARATRELAETRAALLKDLQRKNAELEENQARLRLFMGELEKAKDAAERARAEAELANKAKDHFLAVLSHEMRTPLTPVVMGISMLQDRSDFSPQVRETLDMIRSNVEMEARLIDDLLDVTRIARGKIELDRKPVELCGVINRAIEVCKPDIEARRLHFGVDLGPDRPYWVRADSSRLQQVLWNLLKNAIKFTPPGGCVGILCRRQNEHVLLEVNDSGIGIESEALPRIFAAFEQAERSITRQFGGLGLGLAISKALVEIHGGQIEALSEGKNKGATFRIKLPLSAPATQSQMPTAAVSYREIEKPLRILLVEDHSVTALMMRMALTERGHSVQVAGDVATALELAGRHTFDVLLSDLGLPDATGYDLVRELRSRGYRFPAVALSGFGQEEDIQQSLKSGFAAHLTKPASREAVLQTVASVATGNGGSALESSTQHPPERLVFDPAEALKRCYGNREMLDEMIRSFHKDSTELLDQIRRAISEGNFSDADRAAHRLKGSLIYLGAQPAADAASKLEQDAKISNLRGTNEAMKDLELQIQLLDKALTSQAEKPESP